MKCINEILAANDQSVDIDTNDFREMKKQQIEMIFLVSITMAVIGLRNIKEKAHFITILPEKKEPSLLY